jgi:ABC-type Fe3+/spermidine/putrescine transport system ATPase subunit
LTQKQIPAILVTHDRNDALLFTESVWIILQGEIVQSGTPQEVFPRPASVAIAKYLGVENLLPGRVTSHANGLSRVRCGGVDLHCEGDAAEGQAVYVGVRPEDIVFLAGDTSHISLRNQFEVFVGALEVQGTFCWVSCTLENNSSSPLSFRALLTRAAVDELDIREKQPCRVGFKASAAHLLPRVLPQATTDATA